MSKSGTKVEQIKTAVRNLLPSELDAFREWYEAFAARGWDEHLEEDVESGNLDALAAEARAHYEAGLCSEL
jgi:hypothetical protein